MSAVAGGELADIATLHGGAVGRIRIEQPIVPAIAATSGRADTRYQPAWADRSWGALFGEQSQVKVYMVNPDYPRGLGTPQLTVWDSSSVRAVSPNLALPTLAALTPDVDVTFCDELVETIDLDFPCEVVALTGYVVQAPRMLQLAREFRRRGRKVVVGGPYVSLNPGYFAGHADVQVEGEAERLWPIVARDLARGQESSAYKESQVIDLNTTPVPIWDQVPAHRYATGVVQTSRGCPYACEFCDVIVYLGRKQRHKRPERVLAEVEAAYRHGFQTQLIADDNFGLDRPKALKLLSDLRTWNDDNKAGVTFMTQADINIAQDDAMLESCRDAGMRVIFMGIETPNVSSLKEANKRQNLKADLLGSLERVHSHGIDVHAGLVVGFDNDTRDIFRQHLAFWQASGTSIVNVNVLNAPFGTAIYKRLEKAGRILDQRVQNDSEFRITNFAPLQLSMADLAIGRRWLLNQLYSPKKFFERIERLHYSWPGHLPDESRNTGRALSGMTDLLNYHELGSDYAEIPQKCFRLWRDKPSGRWVVVMALILYKTWINSMKVMGVLEPELATLDDPPFDDYDLMGRSTEEALEWYTQTEF